MHTASHPEGQQEEDSGIVGAKRHDIHQRLDAVVHGIDTTEKIGVGAVHVVGAAGRLVAGIAGAVVGQVCSVLKTGVERMRGKRGRREKDIHGHAA